jgi:Mrp family chromosome partitioning ATPase
MEEVLRTATEHFDFVLLDSAPLLPVFDTHALTAATDAVILVARAGVTTRRAVKTSVELVDRVSGRITGVVLNDVNLSDLARHYYHGAYNYEYGH